MDDLEEPALQKTPRRKPGLMSSRFWTTPVSTHHSILILLAHSFVTGLIDASVFSNYSVFVAMQTGNTVILALSTASLPPGQPYSWLTTLVSIGAFLLGALLTAHVSYKLVPLRRSTLVGNLMLQGLLVGVSAILVSIPSLDVPVDNHGDDARFTLSHAAIVAVIPCLAFQSGMQIATSKLMGVDEVPVNVVTSLYAGLMGDPDLFVWRKNGRSTWGWYAGNVKRSRRLAAVACVLGGALCAAWILKRGPGLLLSLWLGAGIKVLVALVAAVGMVMGSSPNQEKKVGGELRA